MYEHRLASDPDNPLKLYDCLAPALRQYVRIPIQRSTRLTHKENLQLQVELKELERETVSITEKAVIDQPADFNLFLFQSMIKKLREEVLVLKYQNETYKE